MISSLKTDLLDLKKKITANIEGDVDQINTPEYQVYLDLLTNFPIKKPMSTDEFLSFFKKSVWIQSVSPNSNFGLFNTGNLNRVYNEFNMILEHEISKSDKGGQTLNLQAYKPTESEFLNFIKTHDNNVSYNIKYPNKYLKNITLQFSSNSFNLKSYISNIALKDSIPVNNITSTVAPNNLDPIEFEVIQVPTDKLNYFIKKNPFLIKNTNDSDILSTSTFTFPKKETLYDLIVYSDRIIYLSGSKLNGNCSYKVFSIPSLELIESGSDIKLNVYTKLNITRANIVGPNCGATSMPVSSEFNLIPFNIVSGFRIFGSYLFDIYMNSIRKLDKLPLRYNHLLVNDEKLNMYI